MGTAFDDNLSASAKQFRKNLPFVSKAVDKVKKFGSDVAGSVANVVTHPVDNFRKMVKPVDNFLDRGFKQMVHPVDTLNNLAAKVPDSVANSMAASTEQSNPLFLPGGSKVSMDATKERLNPNNEGILTNAAPKILDAVGTAANKTVAAIPAVVGEANAATQQPVQPVVPPVAGIDTGAAHVDTKAVFQPGGGSGYRQVIDDKGNIILTNVDGNANVQNQVSDLRGRNVAAVFDGQEVKSDLRGGTDLGAVDNVRDITQNRHTGQPNHGEADLRENGGGNSDTIRHLQNTNKAEQAIQDFRRTGKVVTSDLTGSIDATEPDQFKPAPGEGQAVASIPGNANLRDKTGTRDSVDLGISKNSLNEIGATMAEQSARRGNIGPDQTVDRINDTPRSSLSAFVDRIREGKRTSLEKKEATASRLLQEKSGLDATNARILQQQKDDNKTFTVAPGQKVVDAQGNIKAQGEAKETDFPKDVEGRYESTDDMGNKTIDHNAKNAFKQYFAAIKGKGNSREAQAAFHQKANQLQTLGPEAALQWIQQQIQADPASQSEFQAIYQAAFPPQQQIGV